MGRVAKCVWGMMVSLALLFGEGAGRLRGKPRRRDRDQSVRRRRQSRRLHREAGGVAGRPSDKRQGCGRDEY